MLPTPASLNRWNLTKMWPLFSALDRRLGRTAMKKLNQAAGAYLARCIERETVGAVNQFPSRSLITSVDHSRNSENKGSKHAVKDGLRWRRRGLTNTNTAVCSILRGKICQYRNEHMLKNLLKIKFEQEAYGPHHSPEKQFQPINTLRKASYGNTITLIQKNHSLLFENWMSCCVKTRIPFTHGCFVPNLVEIVPVILKRKFF